jgi:hypothetical protein
VQEEQRVDRGEGGERKRFLPYRWLAPFGNEDQLALWRTVLETLLEPTSVRAQVGDALDSEVRFKADVADKHSLVHCHHAGMSNTAQCTATSGPNHPPSDVQMLLNLHSSFIFTIVARPSIQPYPGHNHTYPYPTLHHGRRPRIQQAPRTPTPRKKERERRSAASKTVFINLRPTRKTRRIRKLSASRLRTRP